MQDRKTAGRMAAAAVMMLLLFAVVLCSLALLCTNKAYARAARGQSENKLLLSEGRGNIFDCNFKPLTNAQNTVYALFPPGSKSYRTWFESVAPEEKTAFYEAIQRAQPFLIPVSAQQELPEYTFYNPERYFALPIAPHLLGYLDAQGQGVTGVEYAYNDLLKGGSTREDVYCVTNAQGNFIDSDEPRVLYTQGTGSGVMLTLDADIQRICEGVAAVEVDKGCVLVLESATGRVRASVSRPVFDPRDVAASIRRNDTSLINRAVSAFSVGSVFKPLLAAQAIEAGFNARAVYECTGAIEVNGHTYHCFGEAAHGPVDLQEAIEQSCNCYFVDLGLRLGARRVHSAAALAGLGRRTTLAGTLQTTAGNLPTVEELTDRGQLATVSFGQGALTASPLQVAASLNVFANGGVYVEPTFVEGIVNEYTQQVTESLYAPVQRQVFSQKAAAEVKDMMIGVVEEGLGKAAKPQHGGAGGKTGTAQTGRFTEDGQELVNAWFVGFWPAEEPQYTIAVMLDDGAHTSTDAARVFADVTNALYYYQSGMEAQPAEQP